MVPDAHKAWGPLGLRHVGCQAWCPCRGDGKAAQALELQPPDGRTCRSRPLKTAVGAVDAADLVLC